MIFTIGVILLSTCFLLNIIWIYEPGTSLFSWHPTFMIAGQVLALQGVLLFGKLNHKWRLTIHWIFGGLSLVAFVLGFSVIYINKENRSKPHFVSWHGLAGLSTVIIIICQSIGGGLAKYRITFGSSYLDKTKLIKKAHRLSGIFSIFLSILTSSLVIQIFTPLWIGYSCAFILPVVILSCKLLPKLLGLKSSKKSKS